MPALLDDEIKGKLAFATARSLLTAEGIMEAIPFCNPLQYNISEDMPFIGKFPVDQWVKDGRPVLGTGRAPCAPKLPRGTAPT